MNPLLLYTTLSTKKWPASRDNFSGTQGTYGYLMFLNGPALNLICHTSPSWINEYEKNHLCLHSLLSPIMFEYSHLRLLKWLMVTKSGFQLQSECSNMNQWGVSNYNRKTWKEYIFEHNFLLDEKFTFFYYFLHALQLTINQGLQAFILHTLWLARDFLIELRSPWISLPPQPSTEKMLKFIRPRYFMIFPQIFLFKT